MSAEEALRLIEEISSQLDEESLSYLNNFKEKYYSNSSNQFDSLIKKLNARSNSENIVFLRSTLSDKAQPFNILCFIDSIPIDEDKKMADTATSLCGAIGAKDSLESFNHKTPELVKQAYDSGILQSITSMYHRRGMITKASFNLAKEMFLQMISGIKGYLNHLLEFSMPKECQKMKI